MIVNSAAGIRQRPVGSAPIFAKRPTNSPVNQLIIKKTNRHWRSIFPKIYEALGEK
jgi:hypothetical protein